MIAWARDSVATGLERMLHVGVTTVREMAGDARLAAELNRAALVEGASLPSIHYAARMAGPTFYEQAGANRSWIGYPTGTAPWAQAVTAETDVAHGERYGTIEVDKVADLVVLTDDPTEDIGALRSVVAVFKGGRCLVGCSGGNVPLGAKRFRGSGEEAGARHNAMASPAEEGR